MKVKVISFKSITVHDKQKHYFSPLFPYMCVCVCMYTYILYTCTQFTSLNFRWTARKDGHLRSEQHEILKQSTAAYVKKGSLSSHFPKELRKTMKILLTTPDVTVRFRSKPLQNKIRQSTT
jgi:hypothetical protein